jgi:hypothetical protein
MLQCPRCREAHGARAVSKRLMRMKTRTRCGGGKRYPIAVARFRRWKGNCGELMNMNVKKKAVNGKMGCIVPSLSQGFLEVA